MKSKRITKAARAQKKKKAEGKESTLAKIHVCIARKKKKQRVQTKSKLRKAWNGYIAQSISYSDASPRYVEHLKPCVQFNLYLIVSFPTAITTSSCKVLIEYLISTCLCFYYFILGFYSDDSARIWCVDSESYILTRWNTEGIAVWSF